jgi:hypothetical protein
VTVAPEGSHCEMNANAAGSSGGETAPPDDVLPRMTKTDDQESARSHRHPAGGCWRGADVAGRVARSAAKRMWRRIGVTLRGRCGSGAPQRAQWSIVDQRAAE